MSERRRFSRILYSTPARLSQGERHWQTELIDISLQGALIRRPSDWSHGESLDYHLTFHLAGSEIEIKMEVELSHLDDEKLGLYCHHLDIDSATHLRRMIELNVGDEDLLHRELEELLEEHLEHPHP
ncbi:PilZ domain-containing protein [Aeromonas schubertii]|uniref:Cyclic diguanosine monophosphate-binding protein n=1 Tax=Aeromonas schubertii TaxID=652 RepID=A0A0S2SFN6_9GAMM|nr:PilZ domain-containing protein [Aeromonas schubertii]ALP40495.1 type IV pilus assembly protein PilZ [Aeromonas schubertii]KUE78387.1 pilus assembly protein [Aeromonas schubertii]MBZ6066467.1 PilZ domain-containing protein [Aeromonas schubertii]MBZ6072948.1 PilZ domain-containing protein [Aeromonas schubertii]QCG47110.1 PilZ domain-containing protein [Aeromonas schubertii]